MTKIKKFALGIICLLAVCLCALSACTIGSINHVGELSYIEWRDNDGIFNLRAAKSSAYGCGTITLNGETHEVSFSIGTNKPNFAIIINLETAKKLGVNIDEEYIYNGTVRCSFVPNYDRKNKVLTSTKDNVELFGVNVGKVRLKAYPVDKSEFKIWEILSSWADSDNRLKITYYNYGYIHGKSAACYAKTADGKEKKLTFCWLSETCGFRIYDEENSYNNPMITDQTPILAEGTYKQDGNNVTLTFTRDELFGLQGQSLYLNECT